MSITSLFAADPERVDRLTAHGAGLVMDFTRQRVDGPVLDLLARLADDVQLRDRIESMYRGDVINVTEQRQVLHTALRRPGALYAEAVLA